MEEEMRKRWKSNQEEKWKGQEPDEQLNEREQVEGSFANINKYLNKKASWLSSLQYCN